YSHSCPLSCPTRRSSDLMARSLDDRPQQERIGGAVCERAAMRAVLGTRRPGWVATHGQVQRKLDPVCAEIHPFLVARRELVVVRSEEHTSELQSRENLVC